MKSTRADLNGTGYVVRLETGEDLLETLQRFVAQEGIRNAANVSAIGSASSWRFHVVASAEIPPREVLTFGRSRHRDVGQAVKR